MIIDGRGEAREILNEVKDKILRLKQKPVLAIFLVGNDPASFSFIKQKEKAGQEAGIEVKIYRFEENISTTELRKKINEITKAKTITGVIVQLPLPKHINYQYILDTIPQEKDADMLSKKSWGSFVTGKSDTLPPVVCAVDHLMEENEIDYEGKNVCIFGYGNLVGKPLTFWFAQKRATVTVVNEFTKNPEEFSKKADIIISGVGKPGLIKADMVKEGTTVFDFGFAKIKDSISGDVDFENVKNKCSLITPVPGGMGPLTVAFLFKNLFSLAMSSSKKAKIS